MFEARNIETGDRVSARVVTASTGFSCKDRHLGKKYPQIGGALSIPLSELPTIKALLARTPPAGAKATAKRLKKARQKR